MVTEIGLLSMSQIQKVSQSQHNKNQPLTNPNSTSTTTTTISSSSWMWSPKEHQEDDDSWEVRAFAEDTRNIMGTTWPPRSYTCTFCRREFRSAQALGGHMNVHRRDRARLHQAPPPSGSINRSPSHHHLAPAYINIPPQELVANAGLCLLYHLPSPNNNNTTTFTTTTTTSPNHSFNPNASGESPSTLLSISSYSPNNLMVQTCSPSFNFQAVQATATGINNSVSSYCFNGTSKVEEPATSYMDNGQVEEVDLELRLGHKPTPT
ncbi:hypothetical protein RIF29_36909 [Crotalaria pallida]|uniref:C2H2-type domain-containing protein n=1 Tax=Crotalaria pallida TaxID=3830 RepID=A0AAN9EDW2_CROPI